MRILDNFSLVRYGTSVPINGVRDGELFVEVVEDSDNVLYIWNGNTEAWVEVTQDSDNLTLTTLTLGSTVFSESELALLDGVTAGTLAASKAVTQDANQEMDGVPKLRMATATLTGTQVQALNSTPIEVVAAPGAGNILVFEYALVNREYGTVVFDFTTGDDLYFEYSSSGDTVSGAIDHSLLILDTDRTYYVPSIATSGATDIAFDANPNLGISVTNVADCSAGDSVLNIAVFYRVFRESVLTSL